jgi:hypothetical protein
MREIKIKYLHRGSVLVRNAFLVAKGPNVVAIYVEAKSKNYDIMASMHHKNNTKRADFYLSPDEKYSAILGKRKGATVITFPEFEGWDLFLCEDGAKYSFNICLTRK